MYARKSTFNAIQFCYSTFTLSIFANTSKYREKLDGVGGSYLYRSSGIATIQFETLKKNKSVLLFLVVDVEQSASASSRPSCFSRTCNIEPGGRDDTAAHCCPSLATALVVVIGYSGSFNI